MFQFIEFLHSNIDNFKQFDNVINNLYLLNKERHKLNPRKNFADKLKYDEVQAKIKDKFKVIQENIITPIKNTATELNICTFQDEPLYNWYGVESDIHNLKENFSKADISEILKHKSKYLEFRTKTNCTYFQEFFFDDLDEILKELFDFFKDTTENEFEAFETKAIEVENIESAAKLIVNSKGKSPLKISVTGLQQTKEVSLPKRKEKPYKSYTRSVAIYFVLMKERKKFVIPTSKKGIYKLVEGWINPDTGNQIGKDSFYQTLSTGKNGADPIAHFTPETLQGLYPLDYQFAKTLFNKKQK